MSKRLKSNEMEKDKKESKRIYDCSVCLNSYSLCESLYRHVKHVHRALTKQEVSEIMQKARNKKMEMEKTRENGVGEHGYEHFYIGNEEIDDDESVDDVCAPQTTVASSQKKDPKNVEKPFEKDILKMSAALVNVNNSVEKVKNGIQHVFNVQVSVNNRTVTISGEAALIMLRESVQRFTAERDLLNDKIKELTDAMKPLQSL